MAGSGYSAIAPVKDHSPCLPHFLILNAKSKSGSRTDEICPRDRHVKFENKTSGRARLWDTALKFLCPGLFITSPDHLENWPSSSGVNTASYDKLLDQSECPILLSPSEIMFISRRQHRGVGRNLFFNLSCVPWFKASFSTVFLFSSGNLEFQMNFGNFSKVKIISRLTELVTKLVTFQISFFDGSLLTSS